MDIKDWLNNNQLSLDIWNKKYRRNKESFEGWLDRVSNNNSEIKRLIKEKKFLFGGRILANRNFNKSSYSNCYSLGFVKDDLSAILEANKQMALTFKAEGGQGISLSKLRPKGTKINNNYDSDGIIPFMKIFNTTTEGITQGNSRKGALMMSLDIWHKEAANFITIKSDKNMINKANLSVEIDDKFMIHVINAINTGIDTPVKIEMDYSGNNIEYEVQPLKLFKLLCKKAKESAEPGVLFTNTFRNYNLMEFCNDYNIETSNPCGEQPLPAHGSCNLCSINLSEYVINPYNNPTFDTVSFKQDIETIVRAMDVIIDENIDRHALEEQKAVVKNYRNMGIGIMGLADAFVKLGYTYGYEDSVVFCNFIARMMFRTALLTSVDLGEEMGSYPAYCPEVWDSTIILNSFEEGEILDLKKRNCLRNCSLLSIAPTGSIATMLNVSTGIEPYFALKYSRKTESLNIEGDIYYDVNIKEIDNYFNITGNTNIPNYFVSSENISSIDRIDIQASWQKYVDTAISSTINLPKTTTEEEVQDIYIRAWYKKLKGITIYVDGSRDPILSTSKSPSIINNTFIKRPKYLEAEYYQVKIKGTLFIVLVGLLNNKPYEIFTFKPLNPVHIDQHKGKITKVSSNHYKFDSDFINISSLSETNNKEENMTTFYISMLLRHNVDIKYIIKTAKKVDNVIASFTSAICRILSIYVEKEVLKGELCPECNEALIREGGCIHCSKCSYSKCG